MSWGWVGVGGWELGELGARFWELRLGQGGGSVGGLWRGYGVQGCGGGWARARQAAAAVWGESLATARARASARERAARPRTFMVALPGFQLAGHTSPCSSVNWGRRLLGGGGAGQCTHPQGRNQKHCRPQPRCAPGPSNTCRLHPTPSADRAQDARTLDASRADAARRRTPATHPPRPTPIPLSPTPPGHPPGRP